MILSGIGKCFGIFFKICCCGNNRCLYFCRDFHYWLYMEKLAICTLVAIPGSILKFIKSLICCFGLLLLILSFIALLIYLIRNFCSQIQNIFSIFSGGLSPLMYTFINPANQETLMRWNELVPYVREFTNFLLEILVRIYKSFFENNNLYTFTDLKMFTEKFLERSDYIYLLLVNLWNLFIQTPIYKLDMFTNELNQIMNTFECLNCTTIVCTLVCTLTSPLIGINFISTPNNNSVLSTFIISNNENNFMNELNIQNQKRNLLMLNEKNIKFNLESQLLFSHSNDNRYTNHNFEKLIENLCKIDKHTNNLLENLCYPFINYQKIFDWVFFKLPENINLMKEDIEIQSNIKKQINKFLNEDYVQKFIHEQMHPNNYEKSDPYFVSTFKKLKDSRISIDYYSWIKSKKKTPSQFNQKEFDLNSLTTSNGIGRKLNLIPFTITDCFLTVPPDWFCILEQLIPSDLSFGPFIDNLISIFLDFGCDCPMYDNTSFYFGIPVFTNTWTIIKTGITAFSAIPFVSDFLNMFTIPQWIEDTFFITTPIGTLPSTEDIICAIVNSDYLIVFILYVIIGLLIIISILKGICKFIECSAKLRLAHELKKLGDREISNDKVKRIEKEIHNWKRINGVVYEVHRHTWGLNQESNSNKKKHSYRKQKLWSDSFKTAADLAKEKIYEETIFDKLNNIKYIGSNIFDSNKLCCKEIFINNRLNSMRTYYLKIINFRLFFKKSFTIKKKPMFNILPISYMYYKKIYLFTAHQILYDYYKFVDEEFDLNKSNQKNDKSSFSINEFKIFEENKKEKEEDFISDEISKFTFSETMYI